MYGCRSPDLSGPPLLHPVGQKPCNDGYWPDEGSNAPHYNDQSHETCHKSGLYWLSVQPPTFVSFELIQTEIQAAESDLVSGVLAPGPALPKPSVAGHPAAHAQSQLLLTPGDRQVLDDHGGDAPVDGGGEEGSAVVVGGVDQDIALKAEAAVPARHQRRGQKSVHGHVALG